MICSRISATAFSKWQLRRNRDMACRHAIERQGVGGTKRTQGDTISTLKPRVP
jgi:hypothetical protein